MNNFEFVNGSVELLDFVEPLWDKLRMHHESKSNYFKDRYSNFKFESRKTKFLDENNLYVKVDLIKDLDKSKFIGYCVSTISKDLTGEVDSLYIDLEYRKYGLGSKLLDRSINWMNFNNVNRKIITVADGNDDVLEFYKKHGFYKRLLVLEEKNII